MIWSEDDNIRDWLPRLQAHRGAWVGGLPQNSLQSIVAAYEAGYEMSEFDVRMTSDSIVILFHDDLLGKRLIVKTQLAELKRQIPITTLEELFDWFATTENFKLNIEIKSKNIMNYKLEKSVCELIQKFGLQKRVLISSFNPMSLYKVKCFDSSIYRALLLTFERDHGNNYVIMSGVLNYLCQPHMLNLRYTDYSKHFRQLSKKIPIVLWTVNDLEIYRKYKADIHGIISDEITPENFKD